ncbi:response regulator [Gemmatimonas sp.]|uniref:response regulator n=1 Tax=Gemmatimonas sp. TaxID=1962908 RepID=UPI00398305D9
MANENAPPQYGGDPPHLAQHALLEREALFRTVAESSPVGVFLVDVQGIPTYANQRLLDWFALEFEAFATRAWLDRVHPSDLPGVVASLERRAGTSTSVDEAYRIVVDSHTRWIRVRTQPVMSPEGTTVLGHVGSVVDTTSERVAADERERLPSTLPQARTLESLESPAVGVGHDVNNRLVGILGNASLARDAISSSDRGQDLRADIARAAPRALALTQHLMAFTDRARGDRRDLTVSELVVDGIINGHDGAIRVSSPPGLGTTVCALLPVSRGLAPSQGLPAIDALRWEESGVILLVDDDRGARTVARRILTRAGYTVVEARNGREALDHYDRMPEPPRGVVLDLAMPIMGGAECLLALRARGHTAPVLIISGYDADNVAGAHVRRGEARFLQKPYRAQELLDALRDTLAPL